MTVGGVAIERNEVGDAVGVAMATLLATVAVWLLCCSSLSEKPESCRGRGRKRKGREGKKREKEKEN